MMVITLALTSEDMSRIAAAVSTLSISMLNDAKDLDDVKEGLALAALSKKLIRSMKEMHDANKKNEGSDVCES